jgi:hypothetical protein
MHILWIVLAVSFLLLQWAAWAVISSYVAGLRGHDKLDAFKTGLLFGAIGAAYELFRRESIPDISVRCAHCGTRQDVDATLSWYECWHCEQRSNVSLPEAHLTPAAAKS